MSTLIKSCFSAVAAGLLAVSLHAGAAESVKEKNKADDPVKKCHADCLSIKDTTAYEACMIKCNKTHKSSTPVAPKR